MLSIFDGLRGVGFWCVLFRALLAFACGAAIGLERSYKNRPAGFRTHILICVAAAVASMTGLYLYLNAHLPTDISRIGAQVVSGLGFIGAGTIIVTQRQSIKGLTTAAGLWASGIIGLAIGAGYYEGGLTATALVLVTEVCFARVGRHIRFDSELKLVLRYQNKLALDQVLRHCKDLRFTVKDLRITSADDTDIAAYDAVISLRARDGGKRDRLLSYIQGIPEILAVEID